MDAGFGSDAASILRAALGRPWSSPILVRLQQRWRLRDHASRFLMVGLRFHEVSVRPGEMGRWVLSRPGEDKAIHLILIFVGSFISFQFVVGIHPVPPGSLLTGWLEERWANGHHEQERQGGRGIEIA
jgi:hypothetical protein